MMPTAPPGVAPPRPHLRRSNPNTPNIPAHSRKVGLLDCHSPNRLPLPPHRRSRCPIGSRHSLTPMEARHKGQRLQHSHKGHHSPLVLRARAALMPSAHPRRLNSTNSQATRPPRQISGPPQCQICRQGIPLPYLSSRLPLQAMWAQLLACRGTMAHHPPLVVRQTAMTHSTTSCARSREARPRVTLPPRRTPRQLNPRQTLVIKRPAIKVQHIKRPAIKAQHIKRRAIKHPVLMPHRSALAPFHLAPRIMACARRILAMVHPPCLPHRLLGCRLSAGCQALI